MRFFVAEGAPQNDGGFWAACEWGRRFALGTFLVRVTSEKRRQSRRTPKWVGRGLNLGRSAIFLGVGCACFALVACVCVILKSCSGLV